MPKNQYISISIWSIEARNENGRSVLGLCDSLVTRKCAIQTKEWAIAAAGKLFTALRTIDPDFPLGVTVELTAEEGSKGINTVESYQIFI